MKKIITIASLALCLNGWAQCTLTVTANTYTICEGSSQTMSVSGASTYTWSPAATLDNPNIANPTASPTNYTDMINTTIYTVSGTTGTCVATPVTVTITVNPEPTMIASGATVCPGTNVPTPTIVTDPLITTYSWTVTNNANVGMPASGTGTPAAYTAPSNTTLTNQIGVVTYIPTSINGCVGFPATATIVILPTPSAPILINTSNPIIECQGVTPAITLSVTPYAGCAAVWYNGMTYLITGNTYTPPDAVAGTTYYTVIDSSTISGCTSTATGNVLTIGVTVNPAPAVTYTLVADASPHTWDAYPTYGASYTTYLWSWGDGTTSNGAYPSHTYSVAGTYSICVTVTDANGCTATSCQNDAVSRLGNNSPYSNMVYVNVINGAAGIQQITNSNEVSIYPNPATVILNVECLMVNGTTQITMYDMLGNTIYHSTFTTQHNIINVSDLAEGVYNIIISSNEGVVNKRVVIVR